MRMPFAIVRWVAVFAVANSCSASGPIDVAERLADPVLAARLQPHDGAWEAFTSPGWRSARMGPFYDVGARLPAQADGVFEIGIGQSRDFMLSLVPEAAHGATVQEDAGRAYYAAAWPSTDLIFVATAKRVEWMLVLANAQAPASFRWRVTLPPRLPTVRAENGGLAIADEGGTTRLRMPAPYAVDARGTRRDAQIDFHDGALTLALDTAGLAFPVLLDPSLETAVWEPKTTPPGIRYGGRMVYDAAHSRTVVFGGYSGTARLGDTWTWDGTTWTLVASTGPSPRSAFGMAYDSVRARVVMHGGFNGSANLRDTWEWDGATWTQRSTAGPIRSSHVMAYDAARQRTVLFSGNSAIGDTWTWDGTNWLQVATTGPSARTDAAMGYDVGRQRVVLFGGDQSGTLLGDTWEWDGSAWAQITVTGPPARSDTTLVYDSTLSRLLLYGGLSQNGSTFVFDNDLWTWNGTAWTQVTSTGSPAREEHQLSYDPARDRVVMQGGFDGTRGADDTWEFDGGNWSQRVSTPARRQQHVMAYDSVRGKTVMFGGNTSETVNNYFGDTWEWDGTLWTQRASTGPSARKEAGMVFDIAHSWCLLFGGTDSTGTQSDTWEWDGSGWTRLSTTGPARSNMGIAYDSARNRTVIFGGIGPQGDTWEWDGATWTQRATTGPAARTDPALAYDSARAKTVMFGGYSPAGGSFGTIFGDTWEWDGSTWTQRTNVGSAGGRANHPMSYDSVTHKIVLFGGETTSSPIILGDTEEYDGTIWLGLGATGPAARDNHALAFDSARRRTVMFGLGNDNISTWEFHAHGGPCTSGTQCDTGFCVDSVCCETASCTGACNACNVDNFEGTCHAATAGSAGNPSCTPFACDGSNTSCPPSCSSDTQCATGFFCMGTSCVMELGNGMSCSRGRQCQTGFCVGNVCCGSQCNGNCQTCSATPGTCTSLAAGSTGSPSCNPYLCDGVNGTCPTTCNVDGDCASPARCVTGHCFIPQANGATCTLDAQCTNNHCVDNRCCDSACTGTCQACNRAGMLGVCGFVAAGSDPRTVCPGSGPCKSTCNGGGACAYPGAATTCATGSCTNNSTQHLPSTCDGNGTCVDRGTVDCTPYQCAGGLCLTSCTSSTQCISPNVCLSSMCEPMPDAAPDAALIPDAATTDGAMPPDGAVAPDAPRADAAPTSDAGTAASGDSGCSCNVSGRADPPWLLSFAVLLLRRRRAARK